MPVAAPQVQLDQYGYPVEPAGEEIAFAPGEREDQRNVLAAGGGYAPPIVRDPRIVADVAARMRADGAREGDVLVASFDVLAAGAVANDARVRLNPRR